MILDFYGDQNKLRQTLRQFIFSNTNGLYANVDYYWEKPVDDVTTFKQNKMNQYCKLVYETYKTESEMKLPESFVDGTYTYVLFDVSPFSFNGLRVRHPNWLSLIATHIHFFNGNDRFHTSEFYLSRPFLNGKSLMLTNGANEVLNEKGLGTTFGINEIFTKQIFQIISEPIYQPQRDELLTEEFQNIVFDTRQEVVPSYSTIEQKKFPAGTVFKTLKSVLINGIATAKGVYHIKGIDWNAVGTTVLESSFANIQFVQAYYSAIITDFLNSNTVDVLYLAQIPGANFKGAEGTLHGLVNAVSEKRDELLGRNKHVIVGMEKPLDMEPLDSNMFLWYNLFLFH